MTPQPTHEQWEARLNEILHCLDSNPDMRQWVKEQVDAAISEKLIARIKARDERVARGVSNEQANKIFVLEIALLLETITGKPNPQ